MGITLNSVGQGYITDQVADRSRQGGMSHVLVDMGEIRAIGSPPDGRPWRVGPEDGGEVALMDGAIATSSPDVTRFSPFCHHLFDPATGRSSAGNDTISVVARTAMVRRPGFLVLDEATSALDVESERRIQTALEGLRGRLTMLVIAHRLSTVRHADHILVLEEGRLRESGQWEDLARRPDGWLARAGAGLP